jgi:probable phosphoglycerate mutase
MRHARTAANAAGLIPGQLDVPLDNQGRLQAARAAGRLAGFGVSAILSSDLARASATASELGALTGLPLTLDARLREIDVGTWQGLSRAEARDAFPEEYRAWWAGQDVARGGGETQAAAGRRALQAVSERLPVEPADGPVVVVTHAGTARGLIGSLLGLPVPHWRALAVLGNASWSRLGRDHLGWQLLGHNETAELGVPA